MAGSATGAFLITGTADGPVTGGSAVGSFAVAGTSAGIYAPWGVVEHEVSWHEIMGGEPPFVYQLHLQVLTPTLDRAPTMVAVNVSEASYGEAVTFDIDGVPNVTAFPDLDGWIKNLSLEVADTFAAGTHTVTATQGSSVGSDTFTLADAPFGSEVAQPTHGAPVDPGVTNRWVLQDLLPGGLGTWVMPKNPESWVEPVFERVWSAQHTTAASGQFHLTEGADIVQEWSFRGIITTQVEHEKLAAFTALNRRFYLFDHRDRAWLVTFLSFDPEPRTRKSVAGLPTDWVADYTVRAVAYEQDWEVAP